MHGCEGSKAEVDTLNRESIPFHFRHVFLWDPSAVRKAVTQSLCKLEALRSVSYTRMDQELRVHRELESRTESLEMGCVQKLYGLRSHQSLEFSENLKEEIVTQIDGFLSRHRRIVDSLEHDVGVLSQTLQTYREDIQTHLNSGTEDAREFQRASMEFGKSAATRVLTSDDYVRVSRQYFEYRTARESFETAQNLMSQFIEETYKPSMSTILNMFEDVVKSCNELYDDCYQKLIIFEVSLNRGIQYELNRLTTDSISLPDIQQVREKIPEMSPTEQLPYVTVESRLLAPSLSNSLDLPPTVLESISSSTEDLDPNLLESFRSTFSSHPSRAAFVQHIQSEPFLVSNLVSLRNLGRLIWVISDECMREPMDVLCVRKILVMAKHICVIDPSVGRKKFLQSEIYHHKIWSIVKFWQHIIAISIAKHICDQHSCISIHDLGTYMLMFGLSYDASRRIIGGVFEDTFSWLPNSNEIANHVVEGLNKAAERQLRNSAKSPQLVDS